MSRSRLLLLVLSLAGFVIGAIAAGKRAEKADRELPVYVMAGERMAAGEEIYRRGVDAKPFTYPPFAAVPFVVFAWLPAAWQPQAWFALNYLLVLLLIRWLHGYACTTDLQRGPPRPWLFWLITGVFGGRHVASVFANQSHDLWIAAVVALTAAAWSRGRSAAAVWAGLGAATKATPLLFLGLFTLRRRPSAVGILLVTIVVATLSADGCFPRVDGQPWWRAWYDTNLRVLEVGGTASAPGAWNAHSFLNQSLSGTLTRWFTPVAAPSEFVHGQVGTSLFHELPTTMFKVVNLGSALAVLALIAFGIWRSGAAVRAAADRVAAQLRVGLGECAAIACGMVLLSPQSSKTHFCVWLFPVAFVADRITRSRDAVATALFVAAAVIGLPAKDLIGAKAGNVLLAYGNVTWATLLLLLATVRCLATPGVVAGDRAPVVPSR